MPDTRWPTGAAGSRVEVGPELHLDGRRVLSCPGHVVEEQVESRPPPVDAVQVERRAAHVVDRLGVGGDVERGRDIEGDVVVDELADVGHTGAEGGVGTRRRLGHGRAQGGEQRPVARGEGQPGGRAHRGARHVSEPVAARPPYPRSGEVRQGVLRPVHRPVLRLKRLHRLDDLVGKLAHRYRRGRSNVARRVLDGRGTGEVLAVGRLLGRLAVQLLVQERLRRDDQLDIRKRLRDLRCLARSWRAPALLLGGLACGRLLAGRTPGPRLGSHGIPLSPVDADAAQLALALEHPHPVSRLRPSALHRRYGAASGGRHAYNYHFIVSTTSSPWLLVGCRPARSPIASARLTAIRRSWASSLR